MKNNIRCILITFALIFNCLTSFSQNLKSYKNVIHELSSEKYEGRGYYNNGVNKAADYIAQQYAAVGAMPVKEVQFQPFEININTFQGNVEMSVDGKKLNAGDDFVMREFSPGVKGHFPLYYLDTIAFSSEKMISDLMDEKNANAFVVVDFLFYHQHSKDFRAIDTLPSAGVIKVWSTPLKFYKAYGHMVWPKPIIWVNQDFPKDAKYIDVDVDNEFLNGFKCSNVLAGIKGKHSDSTFVFVAHYDHLGHFGKDIYFPGANDNASGTAMLISLAEYYAQPQNQPEYDMLFISVAGEETGLEGSTFYTENPVLPLENIKYLINLDMIGDNSGELFAEVSEQGKHGFQMIKSANDRNHYFKTITENELAANSDHYPFAQKNVPCLLFIQETGDAFPFYHTYHDSYENAFFDTYEPLFNLIRDFVSQY